MRDITIIVDCQGFYVPYSWDIALRTNPKMHPAWQVLEDLAESFGCPDVDEYFEMLDDLGENIFLFDWNSWNWSRKRWQDWSLSMTSSY